LHVFTHNPWLDKKPGMTLDGVGLYFQRDQTWFRQSKAWIEYLTRCQALLQMGKPVVDIAVFTGEEVPRRSVLPDRLINTLPGIFGKEKVEAEKKRLQNEGQPMRQIPDGVSHSANMADPENWIDPLNGYKYDCFNPDVLMQMKVVNGKVVTPGGASYAVLVIPGKHPMNPNGTLSAAVLNKLKQLAGTGAKIIIDKEYINTFTGNKNVVAAPYTESSFAKIGVKKDLIIENNNNSIAWTHRKIENGDIFFISNQTNAVQYVQLSFNIIGKIPEVIDPVTRKIYQLSGWKIENSRLKGWESLEPYQSIFIVFRNSGAPKPGFRTARVVYRKSFDQKWNIQFYNELNHDLITYKQADLKSWTEFQDTFIKYYSGTAIYRNAFEINNNDKPKSVTLQLDSIYNIATIKVNGIDLGTLWVKPYEMDITKAVKMGENKIEIEVTNTWHNRLIGDALLPPEKRSTWTTAPFRLKDKPLLPAGLVGNVKLIFR
jgi:hypothetical protein